MAQTSRKRRTKHRGNAAGMVTSRGRTSRPPAPPPKKKGRGLLSPKEPPPTAAQQPKGQRPRAQATAAARTTTVPARYQKPPTWRSSAIRATIPTVMIFPILLLLHRSPGEAVSFSLTAFVIYVPMTYLIDSRMYRRFQKKAPPPPSKKGAK